MHTRIALTVSVFALVACGPSMPSTDAPPPQFPPVIGSGGGGNIAGGGAASTGGGTTGGGAAGGGAGGGAAPTPQVLSSLVIDPAGVSTLRPDSIDLKQDAVGTLHLIYASGGHPRYGRCSFDCAKPTSWRFLTLTAERADFHLQMGISRSGQVYLAWEDFWYSYSGNTRIRFAQCVVSGCTAMSDWTVFTLATSASAALENDRDLVVDDVGRVHLLLKPDLQTSYFTCAGNCGQASSWSSIALNDFSCEHSSLAVGGGRVGAACVRQGAVKFYQCFATSCTAPGSWTMLTVSTNALQFSQVSLSYDYARPRLAWFDYTNSPNLWTCNGACSSANDWSGISFASAQSATSMGGLNLTVTETGESYLTTAVDGAVRVRRCAAEEGAACWVPGNAWRQVGTVETAAQAASTVATPVPVCTGSQQAFSGLWDRDQPVLVPVDAAAFVLTRTSDFAGCSPDQTTYRQSRHRVHLSLVSF